MREQERQRVPTWNVVWPARPEQQAAWRSHVSCGSSPEERVSPLYRQLLLWTLSVCYTCCKENDGVWDCQEEPPADDQRSQRLAPWQGTDGLPQEGQCRGSEVEGQEEVFMLSTMHMPQLQHTHGRYEEKDKSEAVIQYIQNMAGADQSDQMISYFPMHWKSLKWWKKHFFHLLTLCTIQTMILLNRHRLSRQLKRMPLDQVQSRSLITNHRGHSKVIRYIRNPSRLL